MNKENNLCRDWLRLFADNATGAAADTAAESGVNATDAALQSGVTAQDAAVQDREKDFEALIKGEYKDLYDARVNETVRRRLEKARETEARYREVAPTLELLREVLGMEPSDTGAIGKELKELCEHRTAAKEQAKGKKAEQQREREVSLARYRTWEREAKALTARYPHFSVERELQSPTFRAMLRAGVDMKSAYLVTHGNEILPFVLSHAVQTARERLSRAVASGSMRPVENGVIPHATASARSDVSQLTRADREAIIRRVREGEKITF